MKFTFTLLLLRKQMQIYDKNVIFYSHNGIFIIKIISKVIMGIKWRKWYDIKKLMMCTINFKFN